MHDGDEIEIVQGRHPVIEVFSDEPFVPNSVYLNNSTDRLLIITGPNMGGKSTVLRQTAIVCILAQMGELRSCGEGAPAVARSRLDARRRFRRSNARASDIHGGDDGDCCDSSQRHAALAGAAR